MLGEREEKESALIRSPMGDVRQKVRPPNKKIYEENLDQIIGQIKEKEGELEKIRTTRDMNIADELKSLKAEKSAAIAKRKDIDLELDKLKKVIPEKMCQLGQLESCLVYKSEEKINSAIQRLELNLKVQHFKLMEEKKIVSEIDRLGRSKKTLMEFQTLKQETAFLRDSQREMRAERDACFQAVGKLNLDEDRLRKNSSSAKTAYTELKQQIDVLYENKRQLVTDHKKQLEEYQLVKKKEKEESWKRQEEYKKSVTAKKTEKLMKQAENTLHEKLVIAQTEKTSQKKYTKLQAENTPNEKYIYWCDSLIQYFSQFVTLPVQDSSSFGLTLTTSMEEVDPVEEIADGQYVLLKKSFESQESGARTKRSSRRNRRGSSKKITLSSDMIQQLAELGLSATSSLSKVAEIIKSLKLKKAQLEKDMLCHDSVCDEGISVNNNVTSEILCHTAEKRDHQRASDESPGQEVYFDLAQPQASQEKCGDLCKDLDMGISGRSCDKKIWIPNANSDPAVAENMDLVNGESSTHKSLGKSGIDSSKGVDSNAENKLVSDPQGVDSFIKLGSKCSVMEDLHSTLGKTFPSEQEEEKNGCPGSINWGISSECELKPSSGEQSKFESQCEKLMFYTETSKYISILTCKQFPSEPVLLGNQGISVCPDGHRSQLWSVEDASYDISTTKHQQALVSGSAEPSCLSPSALVFSDLTVDKESDLTVDEEFPPLVGTSQRDICVCTSTCGPEPQLNHPHLYNHQKVNQKSGVNEQTITLQKSEVNNQTTTLSSLSSNEHASDDISNSCQNYIESTPNYSPSNKWMGTSMAFDKDFCPVHFEDNTITESTRL